jgi:prepilin peptidase CpaA
MDAGRTAIGVCFAIVALAAVWDLLSGEIPNVLTVGGVALGIALRAGVGYTESGWHGALVGVGWAFAGIGLCAILPLISYIRGEIGGGDVKLFAAIGALCGPLLGYNAEAWTYGLVIVAVYPFRLVRYGAVRATFKGAQASVTNLFRPREERVALPALKLPRFVLGPTIFAGLCVAFTFHGVFR